MYIFEVVTFFSCLVHNYKIRLFDEAFFLLPNAYDHETFQGGDMLQAALTHTYAWYRVEWSCGVT